MPNNNKPHHRNVSLHVGSAGKRAHHSVILCYTVSLRLVWAVRPLLRNKPNQTQKIQFEKQTNLWKFKGRLFFIANSGEASATNQPKSTTKNPTHAFQLQLKNKNLRLGMLAHDFSPNLGRWFRRIFKICAWVFCLCTTTYLPSAQGIQKRTLDSLNWSYRSGCRELNQGSPKGGTASILKCWAILPAPGKKPFCPWGKHS